MEKAKIFNIERCSTEDGPGIRTTVFLKGCLLRCKWCANPESQSFQSEILFKSVRCVGCGRCMELCPARAIEFMEDYGMITNSSKCVMCGACVEGCFADARVIQGTEYTVDELMDILVRDDAYYRNSGGGITFSGGEPLLYSAFIKACTEKIHEKGWNVLIETCGYAPLDKVREGTENADIVYCDFKHHSPEEHLRLTGKSNRQIIESIHWLDENFKGSLVLRYPYIPGCNDDLHDVEKFLKFVQKLQSVDTVVFLPYHRLGLDKYNGLGRKYEMGEMESLKVKDIQFLKKYEDKYGLRIQIQ